MLRITSQEINSHPIADSVGVASHAEKAAGKVDIGGTLIHHITNSNQIELPYIGIIDLPVFPDIHVLGMTVNLSPTKHVVMMWLAALALMFVFLILIRPKVIPRGLYNLFEVVIVFIREGVVRPNFGAATDRFVGYFLTLFFFILFMNLVGLIPYATPSTGNIAVTAILAIFTFVVTQIVAIRSHGITGFIRHLTGGTPWFLWPIMVPIEIIGLFTKPFALSIRLFANMTAGHVVILSLLGLIIVLNTYWVAPVSVIFALSMFVLELFVAFLQAYVFTLLSALFIGMSLPHSHSDKEHPAK